jgi:hypothetical protein
MATSIDRRQVERWLTQGLSLHKIADRLHIPWTTFWRQWQRLQREAAPPVHGEVTELPPRPGPPVVDTSLPAPMPSGPPVQVHPGVPPEWQGLEQDLLEVVAWWRERKLQRVDPGGPRDTERWTVHVDKRWIEAIKQEADAERVPIMEIVDRAFRRYFEGR